MKLRLAYLAGMLSISIALGVSPAPAGDVRLRDDAPWDKKLSLDLIDAQVRSVVTLAFRIADVPVVIDDCVTGTVTLQFDNVALRDALTALARIGELDVRPRSEGYWVGCTETGARPAGGGDVERHWLQFELIDATAGETVTRSTLGVEAGSLAQIDTRGVRAEAIDDRGEIYLGEPRSTLRLEVHLDAGGTGADRLRGILEMAVAADGPRRVVRIATTSFDSPLPPGSTAVELAELVLDGRSYRLLVTREDR